MAKPSSIRIPAGDIQMISLNPEDSDVVVLFKGVAQVMYIPHEFTIQMVWEDSGTFLLIED